jgi:hypothetical protein
VWGWESIEFSPLWGLGGSRDGVKMWSGSNDGPNRELSCPEDRWDNLLLGRGVSTYIKGVDKWFPWPVPSSFFMLFGCSLISTVSLIDRCIYLDLVDRILVSSSRIRCPRLMLCSATADLSGWARREGDWLGTEWSRFSWLRIGTSGGLL